MCHTYLHRFGICPYTINTLVKMTTFIVSWDLRVHDQNYSSWHWQPKAHVMCDVAAFEFQ